MPKAITAGKDGKESKSAQVRALLATGMDTAAIAKKVGCSTNLVYVVKSGMGGTKGKRGRPTKRGPGRPRKATADASLNGLEGILAAVQNSSRERAQLRAALEKIQSVIEGVLA
jgi:transposase